MNMPTTVLHNPRCKKSRDAVNYLVDQQISHKIIKYLETPPSKKELKDILKKLGTNPEKIVRKKEKLYKEKGLGEQKLNDDQWLDLLVENPVLIERPIVITETGAAIGRPLENVVALFK